MPNKVEERRTPGVAMLRFPVMRRPGTSRSTSRLGIPFVALAILTGCSGSGTSTTSPASNGGAVFVEITDEVGLDFYFDRARERDYFMPDSLNAGCAFLDFDNDGDLDIFSANGAAGELVLEDALLLENDGTGRYRDVGPEHGAYFREKHSGRGAAVWDFDNDGDLDIVISHVGVGVPATLLRNDGGNRNHWLGVRLVGREGQAAAIGALVRLEAGGRRQVAVNQWTTSYLSAHDPRLHFGLGSHDRVDRLEVRWTDGTSDVFEDLPADRYLTVLQGTGALAAPRANLAPAPR